MTDSIFKKPIIECVPNFSEGKDTSIINNIVQSIKETPDTKILNVSSSPYANRTVVTFISSPSNIGKAIYQAYKSAYDLIDMTKHIGIHPRIGALDVCPIIPISQVSETDCVKIIHTIAPVLAHDFKIPLFCYGLAALNKANRHIAPIRQGGYESLESRLNASIFPDFGTNFYNPKFGAGFIGVRPLLIAYNINLKNCKDYQAKIIAKNLRQARDYPSKIKLDTSINLNIIHTIKQKYNLQGVQFYAWTSGDFSQIAMNITDYNLTSPYTAYCAVKETASFFNIEIGEAELVGLIPLKAVLKSAHEYLNADNTKGLNLDINLLKTGFKSIGIDTSALKYEPVLEYQIINSLV